MAQGPGEVNRDAVATDDTVTAAPSADDIRSQIEQTRAEMSDTIDAIQTRLSPGRVIGDAKDSITDATVGRVKRLAGRATSPDGNVLRTLQDHPLPVALTAAVAAGVLARALRNRKSRGYAPTSTPAAYARRSHGPARSGGSRARNAGLAAAASAGAACCVLWWVPAIRRRSVSNRLATACVCR
jgi:hypothetical protein